MDFQPQKPTSRGELIGRVAVVALALILVALATGLLWLSMFAVSFYSVLGILFALFLYVAAISLVGLTFAPKGNSPTGQSVGFELASRIMGGLSEAMGSVLEFVRWMR